MFLRSVGWNRRQTNVSLIIENQPNASRFMFAFGCVCTRLPGSWHIYITSANMEAKCTSHIITTIIGVHIFTVGTCPFLRCNYATRIHLTHCDGFANELKDENWKKPTRTAGHTLLGVGNNFNMSRSLVHPNANHLESALIGVVTLADRW